jgi:hypothetical protein
VHADAEPSRGQRDRRALHEHRREHDDEDELVDPARGWDAPLHRERGEQDRDRAFQSSPDDEHALAVAEARRREQGPDDERPHDERDHSCEEEPVAPDSGVERRERDREAEHAEDDDLGERGEGLLEDADLVAVGGPDVADEEPGDEHGEEARAVGDRGDAVDDRGAGEARAACRGPRSGTTRA